MPRRLYPCSVFAPVSLPHPFRILLPRARPGADVEIPEQFDRRTESSRSFGVRLVAAASVVSLLCLCCASRLRTRGELRCTVRESSGAEPRVARLVKATGSL